MSARKNRCRFCIRCQKKDKEEGYNFYMCNMEGELRPVCLMGTCENFVMAKLDVVKDPAIAPRDRKG